MSLWWAWSSFGGNSLCPLPPKIKIILRNKVHNITILILCNNWGEKFIFPLPLPRIEGEVSALKTSSSTVRCKETRLQTQEQTLQRSHQYNSVRGNPGSWVLLAPSEIVCSLPLLCCAALPQSSILEQPITPSSAGAVKTVHFLEPQCLNNLSIDF